MSKFTKDSTLYKHDDVLGVIETKPGTAAEYHQRLLEGWSESQPKKAQPTNTPVPVAAPVTTQVGKKTS